ncbi:MAG: S9 family peptidase, partial [Vicinamibacteria bacterium]|nr:S9 family peptidase [Vicinamibacteria bacterium]
MPVASWDVKEDKALTDLYLVKTDGSEARPLTTHESSDTGPVWSPDGRFIAFEAKREGDENPQIYLLPLSGGEAVRLTKVPTGASAPKWFPDSRRVAFLSRVFPDLTTWEDQGKRLKERKDSKMTARVFDKVGTRYWDHWLDDRQAQVYSIGLEGGEPQAITLGSGLELSRAEAGPSSYDVAPDGKEIAFAADTDKTGVDSNFDIYVVPTTGGPARNITTDNPAGDDSPRYSPDGRFIAYARRVIKGFYGDRARLALHHRATAKNRVLTEAWDRSLGACLWTPDAKALLSAIDDAGNGRIYRIDAATGAPTALSKDRTFSALALARDGKTLVALRESFSEPPTLVRVNPANGDAAKISSFNDELLANVDWGRYESVTYKGAGGQDIQMWVVYPPGFDPNKKYPLFLILHGGPHNGVQDAFTFRWNA